MTPSKALFYFCIAFVVGIAIESFVKIPAMVVWGFLVLGVLLITTSFFFRHSDHSDVIGRLGSLLGFCLLILLLGILRLQISEFTIVADPLAKYNDQPGKIMLAGIIIAEPDVRATSQKLKVKISESVLLVTTDRYPEYQYLDAVQMTGQVKTPPEFADFNYKNYLVKDGIYSVMDFPSIEIIPQKHTFTIFSYAYEKIIWVKNKLLQSVKVNFSPPGSDIVKGVVFGHDKTMPKEIKDQFNATGLSHITAVSGSNIVIIIDILMILLLALGFWRGQAFYVAAALIWLYIILIGFPVSGVRAATMGCVVLAAGKLGRQNTNSRVLVLTGALMLWQNPMLLVHDISFQLSFLASLGIIHIKPLLDYYLAIPKKHFAFWMDIIAVTLAAQIITLPIIVFNFGRVSLVAPITNLLILPVVPALTVLGFMVSVAGAFSSLLGSILAFPCLILLTYMFKIVDVFSQPWAAATLENISVIWVLAYYAALAFIIWRLDKYQKRNLLGY